LRDNFIYIFSLAITWEVKQKIKSFTRKSQPVGKLKVDAELIEVSS